MPSDNRLFHGSFPVADLSPRKEGDVPPNLSLNPYSIDAKIAGIGTPVRLATHREKANFDTEMAETEAAIRLSNVFQNIPKAVC